MEIFMEKKSSFDINFSVLFDSLIRRFWLILLSAVIAAGAAYTYVAFFVNPLYSSTATLYIGNREGTSSYSDVTMYETLAKDFEVIIKKRAVLDEVVNKLDLKMSAGALRNALSVTNLSNTRILDITVLNPDPALSKNIVDTICTVASEKIVDIVHVDYVEIVDYGSLSSSPANINIMRSMILAGLAGALICAFIITVRTLMDDKIKNPDDVEFYLELSVLATTPFSKDLESDVTKNTKKKRRHNS